MKPVNYRMGQSPTIKENTMNTMPNPIVSRPKRIARIYVIGRGWYGQTITYQYNLNDHALESVGEFTRDAFDLWLGSHAGDFQTITDFSVEIGNEVIPWANEDNEVDYWDVTEGGITS